MSQPDIHYLILLLLLLGLHCVVMVSWRLSRAKRQGRLEADRTTKYPPRPAPATGNIFTVAWASSFSSGSTMSNTAFPHSMRMGHLVNQGWFDVCTLHGGLLLTRPHSRVYSPTCRDVWASLPCDALFKTRLRRPRRASACAGKSSGQKLSVNASY